MVKWSVQIHSRCCRTPGSMCQETALEWWWHWLVSDYLMLDNMFVLSTPSTQSSMSSILSILRVSTHKSLMNTIGAANVMALQKLEHFWNANSLWTDADLWLQWCKTISVYKKLWPWCTNSVLEQRGFMLLLREWCDRSMKSGLYSFIILIPHTYCSTDRHWHNIAAASASIGLFYQGLWALSYHCSHPKESGRQSPWLILPIDPRHQTEYINMSAPMMGYWDISKHLSKYWNLVKYQHHPQTLLCSIVCEVHSIYHHHYVDIISSCRRWGGIAIVPIN